MTNPNDPAFTGPTDNGFTPGLTKMEYFTAMASQGLSKFLFDPKIIEVAKSVGVKPTEVIAVAAIELAKKVIAGLNEQS